MSPFISTKSLLVDASNIEERVLNVIKDIIAVDVDHVGLDASITEDLIPDSLDQMRLYMALEDEFQDVVPEEELDKIKTVRDVVTVIEAAVKRSRSI